MIRFDYFVVCASTFFPCFKLFLKQAKECSNYRTIAVISHTSKAMLKILQVNQELPDVQAGFRKGRGTRDQIANIHWLIEKAREFQKTFTSAFFLLCHSLWLCESQQTAENSARDGIARPPDLPPQKSVCRTRSNSYNWTWNDGLVPNWERCASRLRIVTLLI